VQRYNFFARYARGKAIFLNLSVKASPLEKEKKKKRTKRIIKKNVTPSTYKYVRNTLNLLNKGGGTARTRVKTPLKRHGGRSDYFLEDFF
jgi:hypothetical protein